MHPTISGNDSPENSVRPFGSRPRGGLTVPQRVPPYLFRGECGDFATTVAAIHRPQTYRLRNGELLAPSDRERLLELITQTVRRFAEDDYALEDRYAIGLMQHYGLPTCVVDFTAHLGYAFSFAAAGRSDLGRVGVLPLRRLPKDRVVDLTDHPWAERPRRQQAFGVIAPEGMADLKSRAVTSRLGFSWYEFPVSESDRRYFRGKTEALVGTSDDCTAGFLRHHMTEYVEERGKVSPKLADWLLERVPIAPRCYVVETFDATERKVVVRHPLPNVLRDFDETREKESSRRYWSSAYRESSWDRMEKWEWPAAGSVVADPRTYHPASA